MKLLSVHLAVIGLVRNFSTCLPQILELYWASISENRFLQSSISFHLSQTAMPLDNPRSQEFILPDADAANLLEDYPHSIFELEKIRDESQFLFRKLLDKGEWLPGDGRNLRNYVEAMWLQRLAYQELKKVQADVFIFCRPDIYPVTPLQIYPWILMGSFFLLSPRWGQYSGTNDRFAIIPRKYLKKYLCRIENSLDYVKQNGPLFPERFLKWSLSRSAHLALLPHDGVRIRSGGTPNRRDLKRTGLGPLSRWHDEVGN